jgi:hypothetical protein
MAALKNIVTFMAGEVEELLLEVEAISKQNQKLRTALDVKQERINALERIIANKKEE